MKKSKILVPAIALLALGVAGSATGTVAWFTAASATSDVVAATGNVTATSGQVGAEKFVITAEVGTIAQSGSVYLTNDSGKTKVFNQTAGTNIEITPSGGAAYATAPISFAIEYTGSAADAAAVLAAWKDFVPAAGIQVTVTDTTEYTSAKGFNAEMIAAEAANKGLKFWTSAPSAAEDWVLSTHKTAVLTVAEGTCEGVTFAYDTEHAKWKATSSVSAGDVYVGIQGLDSIVQDADDTYQFTATPQDLA